MLLIDNGTSHQMTQEEYQVLTRARMIYLCDECTLDIENVFHIMPQYGWKEVDDTLAGAA